jgi:hypothetical protein
MVISSDSFQYYFVDEAGDPVLFGKRGKVIINSEGCSRFFILGVLECNHPDVLMNEFNNLRQNLLSDPYFKKVPSMQPEARKTYYAFHAKDDIPEVRHEVFSTLRKSDVKFLAVVRRKERVLEYVRQRNMTDPIYRYNPNELYDYMVRILFRNLLHKEDYYEITFAKRGNQDRTEALRASLTQAQQRFAEKWGKKGNSKINIYAKSPLDSGGLQAVDYFLWSLQRFYERHEERYLEYLWSKFRLVHDMDDTSKAQYGVYYDKKRPLTLAALDNFLPGI